MRKKKSKFLQKKGAEFFKNSKEKAIRKEGKYFRKKAEKKTPYFLNFIVMDKDIPEIFNITDQADLIGDIICTTVSYDYLSCSYDIKYLGNKKFDLVLLFDEKPEVEKVLSIIRFGFEGGSGYIAEIK